ncbi:MAG: NrfD/PsrC family molybdoenzyme membrane anchor subunit [Thermodesulfobacteriota bacterium]
MQVITAQNGVSSVLLFALFSLLCSCATGSALVAAMSRTPGLRGLAPFFHRSVLGVMVFTGAAALALALLVEEPWRLLVYNAISPNLLSNLWWLTTLSGIMAGCMFLEFAAMHQNGGESRFWIGFIGAVAAMGANNNLAALLSQSMDPPLWHGVQPLVLFLASSLLAGFAALLIFSWAAGCAVEGRREREFRQAVDVTQTVMLFLLLVLAMIYGVRFFAVWGNGADPGFRPAKLLLTGKLSLRFWLVEVAAGILLPAVLLLLNKKARPGRAALAGCLVLCGLMFQRYDMLLAGWSVPKLGEWQGQAMSLLPGGEDLLLSLLVLAFLGGGLWVGDRYCRFERPSSHPLRKPF